ncbi:MAG: TIGR04211 family SH3 domain-containing protein [Woeseiaceae bacterium]|nr:TIGR04211 family SH3 domain-containing protein [Woeseiaceae bacterium]
MRSTIAILVLLLSTSALAETGYVTDRLRLGLHNAEDTSDTPFRYLESGDSFEILSRTRYYAQVQMPDGVTGYVKLNYVVFEPPAKLIVNESLAEQARLEAEIEDMRESFAEPAALIEELRGNAANLRVDVDTATARIAELEAENARMMARQANYSHSLPYTWVGGATVVCLVAGFLLGLWWVDRQNRKRHGGIRVV